MGPGGAQKRLRNGPEKRLNGSEMAEGGFLKGFPGPDLAYKILAGLGFFARCFPNSDAYTGLTRPRGLCLGLPLVFGPAPSLRLGRAWAQNSPKMVE